MLRTVTPIKFMPAQGHIEEGQLQERHAGARDEPGEREIRLQLAAMLSRPEFSASARNRRFLTYVIEETIQGRSSRIKAYTIALAVFDRDQNFDPLIDPIVRIEASRLRRAMEHYYLTAGKDDPVRIDIPKGSYVPKFSYQGSGRPAIAVLVDDPVTSTAIADIAAPASSAASRRPLLLRREIGAYALTMFILLAVGAWLVATDFDWRRSFRPTAEYSETPSILVMPFGDSTRNSQGEFIAAGLTYDIISNLTRYEDLFVFGSTTSFRLGTGSSASIPDTDYLLTGIVAAEQSLLRLNIILTDRRTGRNIWAMDREWPVSTQNIADATNAITEEVASLLARPDGVIQAQLQERIAGKSALNLRSYECIVKFRQAWRDYRQSEFGDIETCLSRTIVDDPAYASAYSALALLNIDRYRFGGSDRTGAQNALDVALRLAEAARNLEPSASHPYLALSLAHWFKHDVEKSIEIAEHGLQRNPENPELLADLGLRYALLGKWSQSEPLLNEAFKRDPGAPGNYHTGHFLYSYMRGDYEGALDEALSMNTPQIIYGHLAAVAAYGKLGMVAAARPMIDRIVRIDPQYASRVRTDLEKRNMAPDIIDEIVDGLKKAGFLPQDA